MKFFIVITAFYHTLAQCATTTSDVLYRIGVIHDALLTNELETKITEFKDVLLPDKLIKLSPLLQRELKVLDLIADKILETGKSTDSLDQKKVLLTSTYNTLLKTCNTAVATDLCGIYFEKLINVRELSSKKLVDSVAFSEPIQSIKNDVDILKSLVVDEKLRCFTKDEKKANVKALSVNINEILTSLEEIEKLTSYNLEKIEAMKRTIDRLSKESVTAFRELCEENEINYVTPIIILDQDAADEIVASSKKIFQKIGSELGKTLEKLKGKDRSYVEEPWAKTNCEFIKLSLERLRNELSETRLPKPKDSSDTSVILGNILKQIEVVNGHWTAFFSVGGNNTENYDNVKSSFCTLQSTTKTNLKAYLELHDLSYNDTNWLLIGLISCIVSAILLVVITVACLRRK